MTSGLGHPRREAQPGDAQFREFVESVQSADTALDKMHRASQRRAIDGRNVRTRELARAQTAEQAKALNEAGGICEDVCANPEYPPRSRCWGLSQR